MTPLGGGLLSHSNSRTQRDVHRSLTPHAAADFAAGGTVRGPLLKDPTQKVLCDYVDQMVPTV